MRKLSTHPIPVLLLLLLLSGSVQPTSPVAEAPGTSGMPTATSLTATSDDGTPAWCVLTCHTWLCEPEVGVHWASKRGDVDEWDGGNHLLCWDKPCGHPPGGKHAPCGMTMTEHPATMDQVDDAVSKARLDQLVEILANNEAVAFNRERRAIQVWSACMEGQLGAHLPLPTAIFDALVLAQQQ